MKFGEWTVESELGRGAAGVVYRAHGPAGQRVALKVLTATSEHARRRMSTELASLTRFEHPHLVRVLGAGEEQGRPFLVMELIDGETLAARLARSGPLPPREAVELTRKLALALEHCHRHGVLHRDLKPANVLLDRRGEPRLVDFGLARDVDASRSRVTEDGQFHGTPGFWPPEQARGELDAIDARSDVYALGATLFAMLTGHAPFEGGMLIEVLERTEREPASPPSRLREGIDPALDRLVLRCLAKPRQERPASALELARELEAWARGERPLQRRSWLRPLLLAALLAAAAALLLADRERRARRDRAHALLVQAIACGRPDERLRLVEVSLELRESVEGEVLRAQALLGLERTAEGLAALDRLCEKHPPNARVLYERASSRPLAEHAQALREVDHALLLDPDLASALNLRVLLRRDAGDLTGALADSKRLLRLWPTEGLSWTLQAELLEMTGDRAAALALLDRAFRIAPLDAVELHQRRGALRKRMGDLDGAGADLFAAARGEPPHIQHGQATRDLGDLLSSREAWEELERVMAELLLRHETAYRRYARGLARYKRGQLDASREDLARAAALAPKAPDYASLLGVVEFARGDLPAAEVATSRALELSGKAWRPDLLQNRAGVRIELRDWAGAEADLERVIAAEPRNAQALARRAVLEHRRGRLEEALPWYERALAIAPDAYHVHFDQADTLADLGRAAEALAGMERGRRAAKGQERAVVEERIRRIQAKLGE